MWCAHFLRYCTKLPQAQRTFREAISLHVQPLEEESSQVWIMLAMTNFEQSDDELRNFQDKIFLQDKPILENQYPRCLPLPPEASIICGRPAVRVLSPLSHQKEFALRRTCRGTANINRILIHDADVVVTMNAKREELPRASVLLEGDAILRVDTAVQMEQWIAADPAQRSPQRTIDAGGCVVTPGPGELSPPPVPDTYAYDRHRAGQGAV